MNIQETHLGYQPFVFTFFPLPRYNVGNSFTRFVNGKKCTYLNPMGVPHTAVDRRWIEIAVTIAKKSKSRTLEFGSVSRTLEYYGMSSTGGKRGYITPAKNALYRFGGLMFSFEQEKENDVIKGVRRENFMVAEQVQLLWGKGNTNSVVPELFEHENRMILTEKFYGLIESAAPHNQDHYMQIQSPLTQDLYTWAVRKLYNQNDEELIRWSWLYAQFGTTGGLLNDSQMKDLRKKIKESLFEIKTKYYEKANMFSTDEGIVLKKSPPVIDPEHKLAGYSPA